jgi:hypothetical protein
MLELSRVRDINNCNLYKVNIRYQGNIIESSKQAAIVYTHLQSCLNLVALAKGHAEEENESLAESATVNIAFIAGAFSSF